jgi:cell wall-associated NlpC family hydrolase
MAFGTMDTTQPLSGFLGGYQQGQSTARQQALDVAAQIAQQHQDEFQQQQADLAQQKADSADDRAQQKQDELERHNSETEKLGKQKLDASTARATQGFGDKANSRVLKEADFLALQGLPAEQAHSRAVAHEILRQHGIPGSSIPGSLPQELDPDELPQPATATPSAAPDPSTQSGNYLGQAAQTLIQMATPSQPLTPPASAPTSAASAPTGAATGAPDMVLPKVAAGINQTQARTQLTGAQTELAQARTNFERAIQDPTVQKLKAQVLDIPARQQEQHDHNQQVLTLKRIDQDTRKMLGLRMADARDTSNNIAQQNANTQKQNADTQRQGLALRQQQAANGGDAKVTARLLQMQGQYNGQWRDAVTKRDNFIKERDRLKDFVLNTPAPTPDMYPNEPAKYQNALAQWTTNKMFAQERLKTVEPRIGELNTQIGNLNDSLKASTDYLNKNIKPINESGAIKRGGPAGFGTTPNPQAPQAVQRAQQMIGRPYVYGGDPNSPNGTDCSGLVCRAYPNLPRTAHEQQAVTARIRAEDLQPGDLVFKNRNGQAYHVGIFAGNGQVIEAAQTGQPIRQTTLAEHGWNGNNVSFGRVPSTLPTNTSAPKGKQGGSPAMADQSVPSGRSGASVRSPAPARGTSSASTAKPAQKANYSQMSDTELRRAMAAKLLGK